VTMLPRLQKTMGNTKPEIYSEHEIAIWMDNEGLDYLVQHFMNPDHIEDPTFRQNFRDAKANLDRIEKRLSPHLEEGFDPDNPERCVLDK
jgi:hypothetical protein